MRLFILTFLILFVGGFSLADWKVDFSRRTEDLTRAPAAAELDEEPKEQGFLNELFGQGGQLQEVVILNTDTGFVPKTVRVRKGGRYRVHVVNVNKDQKNISFVMDAFSEHHSTYYGKIRSFVITPKREGVYSFQSPETAAEGRLVVHPTPGADSPSSPGTDSPSSVEMRRPASE